MSKPKVVEYLTSKTYWNSYGEKVMFFNVDGYVQKVGIPQGAKASASKIGKLFFEGELEIHKNLPYEELNQ